jgi:excisionase family DNA binding protein
MRTHQHSQPTSNDRLAYSIDETARLLSISRRHVYELIAEGRLVGRKLGARRVIPRREIDALLAEDDTG